VKVLRARLRGLVERPDVAIFHDFVPPPYGGSNQFLLALRGELHGRGLRVAANAVVPATRACVLNAHLVDAELLRGLLHGGCRVLHRVDGPLQRYRGFDDGTDEGIVALNREFADVTVVQSRYSLAAHEELGLPLRNPVVIPNAVDPALFPLAGRRVRLISTSWSDNPNKGGHVYEWLDQHLDWGRFEYTFVGRTRSSFRHIRVVPPLPSQELADLLRGHDVYVTASRNDPCSNALLEALACGLPALYLDSGGHPEIVGGAGVRFASAEEAAVALDRLVAEYEERRARISLPSLPDVADRYLAAMGLEARSC